MSETLSLACDGHIITRSGIPFHFDNPTAAMITPADIASSLSKQCRFTGHLERFYSVAEHSVHCSYLVDPKNALAALLHDAAEAYIGDISTPLKNLIAFIHVIEARVQAAVHKRFKIDRFDEEEIKAADSWMLHLEAMELMPQALWASPSLAALARPHVRLRCLPPEEAAMLFTTRLSDLLGFN